MFSKYDASCGSSAVHGEHTRWAPGFFNRAYCRGIVEYGPEVNTLSLHEIAASANRTTKTVNQIRRDMGYPKYVPHKHMYRYKRTHWWFSYGIPHHRDKLEFYCERCPDQRFPAGARIERWKYRDMTMTLTRTEQLWPQ